MKSKKYLISLLFLTIMFYLQGCGKIELSPKDVQVELGAEVSDNILDYIETEEKSENKIRVDIKLDTSAIDSMVAMVKEKECLCPERCYEGLADFPYGNLEYINDETYAVLKQLYEEIDWNPDFEAGNISEYSFYKQKYKALLDGKTTFQITEEYTSKEEVKEESLSTFLDLDSNYDPRITFDGGDYRYGLLFFDIDADGAPELCITEKAVETCVRCTYVFKYKKSENKIILWKTINGTATQIIGSNTIATYWEDRQFNLEKLGTDGEPLISVQFANEFFYANGEECFLAAVPVYAGNKKDTISDEMKMQGYYDELGELYYFHLTEGQYHELTDEFFDVFTELAPKKRQEVTFTYDELFGTGNPFFFEDNTTQVTYDALINNLDGEEKAHELKVNIKKLKELENGTLYRMELEQPLVDDPIDEICLGRNYLGYYYVTEEEIYLRPLYEFNDTGGYTEETDQVVIDGIQKNEKDFLEEECYLVDCREGTERIEDEQGWISYVKVIGNTHIYYRYNTYVSGTKGYRKIIWQEGKGMVYYLHGAGSRKMEVELFMQ